MPSLPQSPPAIGPLIASLFVVGAAAGFAATAGSASDPLHLRIDALINGYIEGAAVADRSTDAEFLRRAHLDFAGDLPTAESVRTFLADTDPDKRTVLVDRLLADPGYSTHMADQFAVFLMERCGDDPHWRLWLESSFAENKPWDQMVREIVRADHRDEPNRGAAFFYSKRLESYGQIPTDYAGLTRDVGRLFLGIDLQCAECHNHRTVATYQQADFQGLFAAYQNIKLYQADFPAIEEGVMEGPLEFASVFNQRKKTTAPRIPGLEEVAVETFGVEDAHLVAPDKKAKIPGIPRFSPLSHFAVQMPESPTFASNIVNRLWFHMIGRGIVEPLDLFHPENPPSHPELLDLLSTAFVESGFDIRSFLREISLTEVYQRSGQFPDGLPAAHDHDFGVARERRLSAEQLFRMVLTATGNSEEHLAEATGSEDGETSLRDKFLDAFTGQPKEPELEFTASLKGTLLLLNDNDFSRVFAPAAENLAGQLAARPEDAAVAEKLYLHVFSRFPTDEEREDILALLGAQPARQDAVADLIWAMVSSTEFATNH
ncbi:hypothetical protein BH23VER1_BH23VER1_00360 [soil metagenome]